MHKVLQELDTDISLGKKTTFCFAVYRDLKYKQNANEARKNSSHLFDNLLVDIVNNANYDYRTNEADVLSSKYHIFGTNDYKAKDIFEVEAYRINFSIDFWSYLKKNQFIDDNKGEIYSDVDIYEWIFKKLNLDKTKYYITSKKSYSSEPSIRGYLQNKIKPIYYIVDRKTFHFVEGKYNKTCALDNQTLLTLATDFYLPNFKALLSSKNLIDNEYEDDIKINLVDVNKSKLCFESIKFNSEFAEKLSTKIKESVLNNAEAIIGDDLMKDLSQFNIDIKGLLNKLFEVHIPYYVNIPFTLQSKENNNEQCREE